MKKFLKVMFMIIVYLAIFMAGYIVGNISNRYDNSVVITSECVGQGVQKSYSAIFESRDGVVIRDERIENATYTTTCKCWAADRRHDAMMVAETEFSSSNENDLHNTCSMACQAWCEYQLTGFKFAE